MPVAWNAPPVSVPWLAPYFFIAVGLCIANDWITSDGKNTPDVVFSRDDDRQRTAALQLR